MTVESNVVPDLDLVEVLLPERDNFLKVKETLTRIGIASPHKPTLYQSCHILHKQQGRYFLVHFKELFMLDGKPTNFNEEDRARRNTIANLLAEWNLVTLVDPEKTKEPVVPVSKVKILPFKEKENWTLVAKYSIGRRSHKDEDQHTEEVAS